MEGASHECSTGSQWHTHDATHRLFGPHANLLMAEEHDMTFSQCSCLTFSSALKDGRDISFRSSLASSSLS
eukprot:5087520-Amphidinium_carterae.1